MKTKTRSILFYVAILATAMFGYLVGHFDALSLVGQSLAPARIAEPVGLPLEQRQHAHVEALAAQLVSGQFNTVPPTFASGSSIPIQTDSAGKLLVSASIAGAVTPATGFANPSNALSTFSLGGVWNGATWDRWSGTSGIGNVFDTTVNTSVQSVVTNTTGLATQTTLSALNAKFSALGPNTMANSTPVTISSNQTAIPVSGTVTANVVGATTPADTFANPTNTVPVFSFDATWNGTTWDRHKGTNGVGTVCGGATCQQMALEQGNLQSLYNVVNNAAGLVGGGQALGTSYAQFSAEWAHNFDLGTVKAKTAKGANGTFHSLSCNADSTAVGVTWVMLVDKATAPVDTNLPAFPAVALLASGHVVIGPNELGDGGQVANNGISWALSSTPFVVTLTSNAANLFSCDIKYH